ncbi:uncharacterized protein LOC128231452 [Mya arenaria]|uniref:uncharacterized protein LOC128231452 n=1 Tax=Mya arenaria TaxID=6604 RepID=UPI0022E00A43|nr:uncharacterized protein LOC128231452 [Mya arenaria]
MDEFARRMVVLACVFFGVLLRSTDCLSCYQCNVYIRGTPWPCDSDKGMRKVDDCHACLKTFTRSYLHNTFHDQILTNYESRVCVKDREYLKEEGCHPREVASGYMKRCFCYDDYCNASGRASVTLAALLGIIVSGIFVRKSIS